MREAMRKYYILHESIYMYRDKADPWLPRAGSGNGYNYRWAQGFFLGRWN